jgi:hypothetical protein
MRYISIVITQLLILAAFAALMVFYGLAFWHWRGDAKRSRPLNPNQQHLNGTQWSELSCI